MGRRVSHGGRVLLLADTLAGGGAERQLALLARNLPTDWHVQVWSLGGGVFADELRDAGISVSVHERRWKADPGPSLALSRAFSRWMPTVVHCWGWMSSLAAVPLCRLKGVPLVNGTIRMGALPARRRLLQRLGLALADRVVANSHAGLAAWRIGPARGCVVYNGLDPSRLALCDAGAAPTGGTPFRVVMTGRLVPEKDFDTYLSAARMLASAADIEVEFLVVGDGPDRSRLEREGRDLIDKGIARFEQPGWEVLQSVARTDVGVLLTNPRLHAEGCSNSIMEYMACGIPVVCTEGGGNSELVVDGETGFLVRPDDPLAVARRLDELRCDVSLRSRLGGAGRARVLDSFSLEAMVANTVAVYEELARRPSAGRARQ